MFKRFNRAKLYNKSQFQDNFFCLAQGATRFVAHEKDLGQGAYIHNNLTFKHAVLLNLKKLIPHLIGTP
jgi:hypothetical protein